MREHYLNHLLPDTFELKCRNQLSFRLQTLTSCISRPELSIDLAPMWPSESVLHLPHDLHKEEPYHEYQIRLDGCGPRESTTWRHILNDAAKTLRSGWQGIRFTNGSSWVQIKWPVSSDLCRDSVDRKLRSVGLERDERLAHVWRPRK